MDRRSALRFCCATAALPFACRTAHAGIAPFPMEEVAAGIHVRRGIDQDASAANDDAIANLSFVIGADAVAVIDPGGSRTDGQRLRASIRAVTSLPIRYVVLSHVHPDHIFGASAFLPDQPRFVGHARLPHQLAERGSYYRQRLAAIVSTEEAGDFVMPDLLVENRAELDLGGRKLSVTAHPTAHTDNDLSLLDEQTATLFAADLLFIGRVPSLDGSLPGWLGEIERLKALPARLAVPGHGPVAAPWPACVADMQRYLATLAREIRAMIARGADIETAVETVGQSERDRWTLFDDYNGHNVTVAFKELEWE